MTDEQTDSGRPRVGWLCPYVPEELIMAAGLEPVRVQGRVTKIKEADAHLVHNFCPYLKNILDSGLRGRLEDLDGLVFTNSCDGLRRLYDLWSVHVETPFIHFLELPRNVDQGGITYFAAKLVDLKSRLEEAFGKSITDQNLREAISAMNEQRESILSLFELQKRVPAPFKGSDLLGLCWQETTRPKAETRRKARDMAKRPSASGASPDKLPRIMVMGNLIDRPFLFQTIEAAGASVVLFDTCHGLKHYTTLVEGGPDPIIDLATRYLLRPSCGRLPGRRARLDRVGQLIDEYAIDGLIHSGLTYCDYSLFETPPLEDFLKANQVPLLVLENDYLWSDAERLKTRIEAFLEVVGGGFE
ncbi:MAG: 2-hydroxyacyl-CoA dehydratase family protein [Proteobacteria bacterium]|nr:2-hydroxyacyl-CoA dehydratase family protein [Pseudomonadota bacterium]